MSLFYHYYHGKFSDGYQSLVPPVQPFTTMTPYYFHRLESLAFPPCSRWKNNDAHFSKNYYFIEHNPAWVLSCTLHTLQNQVSRAISPYNLPFLPQSFLFISNTSLIFPNSIVTLQFEWLSSHFGDEI